jgi:hypothetical protein
MKKLNMKKMFVYVMLAGVYSLAPAYGHHSFAAEYDSNKPMNLKGTVTQIEG